MKDYNYYKQIIKAATAKIKHLNKLVSGVERELNKQTNKAVLQALKERLLSLQKDIKNEKRDINTAERTLDQIKRNTQ